MVRPATLDCGFGIADFRLQIMAQGFRICDFEFWKAVFEEMLVDRGENWEAGRRGSVVARMSTVIARTKSNRLPKIKIANPESLRHNLQSKIRNPKSAIERSGSDHVKLYKFMDKLSI